MSTAIEISSVSKHYTLGRNSDTLRETLSGIFSPKKANTSLFKALDNVSFNVERGESVGIIGKNGAGKSTLLKILSRISQPTEGEVKIFGKVSSLLEVGTGFHPELTGRENIFLNGSILGMSRIEIKLKLDQIIEFSGIEQFLDTPVKRYSSGMYVRLAFAVAAHLDPEILIVDEVLSVGDAEFQQKCMGKMNEVASGGRTILFVSHNMDAVKRLCPKAVWLKQGTVNAEGKSDDLVRAYLDEFSTISKFTKAADRTDRQGSGDLQLQDVQLLTEEDNKIVSGKPLRIRLQIKSNIIDPAKCLVTVGIRDADRRRIGTLSTRFEQKLLTLKGHSNVYFDIPKLTLAPGKYYMNVFIAHRTENDISDWIEDAATFEVSSSSFHSQHDEHIYTSDIVKFVFKSSVS